MKRDFYLDSGVIFSHNFTGDLFYPECIEFFKRYPVREHNFYSTIHIVNQEINKLRNERTNGITRLIRLIDHRAKMLVPFLINVDHSTHALYNILYQTLLHFLERHRTDGNPKEHDAILLSNAHIWDLENPTLNLPHFITIDDRDIGNDFHRGEIQKISNACLSCNTRLTIRLVSQMI